MLAKSWPSVLALSAIASLAGWGTAAIAFPSVSSRDSETFQIAQTAAGYCTVADPTGTPLNVRSRPGGDIIGTLENGTVVAVGVTDGSEGPDWTRIIQPYEGYVWSDYLTDCS
ncbi:MAG: SH3 domain-containing protein [Limnospira sp.]